MHTTPAPSGKQFTLRFGDQHAVVTEVGAALRRYAVADVDVLDGYAATEMCTDARGQTFIPWPNRIADGRYEFGGEEHQLPLSEPAVGNAIHGLTRWVDWRLVRGGPLSLRFAHHLAPQPGYPFDLRCEITYRIGEGGLRVETRATNVGARPCPYATGAHPYIRLGAQQVDDLEVHLPARVWYPTDDRGIPTGRRPVDGTDRDLRTPRRIGSTELDTAFTDLVQDTTGTTTVQVSAPGGHRVDLWMDGAYRYVELFTGDSLPEPERRRRSLGVEPMTAAPNAFRTGDGLRTLEPGETTSASWGLRPGLT
ncbi:aldose epimerase [Geodermatophilus sp. TF02-6]|uniref:aldose 1-epimerase family protein n=1 Tax=Geodermatophilus sp. TF02-6 TaxID=2250575 RepID=UPI000DEAB037|nr:aldose 1-epimerase family protein [Geodermatophilus sp. TF02-6]RBY82369.1 aldose epimerase [Geodermatophilus sp. TF02-6]